MKNLMGLILMVTSVSAAPAFASTYSCSGKFVRKIQFDLNVGQKGIVLTTETSGCKGAVDLSYRPTAKYEGYSRFLPPKEQFEPCKALVVDMIGRGNTFDSIKVSGELLSGEDRGDATFIYDTGDFHGQLANERVTCTVLQK